MPSYKTVKKRAHDEFTEKRSRFIGYVCPVQTVEEANGFISEIKQKHWDAKHNVYAYILRDGNIKKYSDDGEPQGTAGGPGIGGFETKKPLRGEPQGTAGVPVLDVLEKSDVKDVCVVATRYFGGILLGGGGLVRAYSHTAKIALDSGVIVTMAKCDELCVLSDYNYYGKLASLIPENGGTLISADFADNVKVKFSIPCEKSDNIKNLIVDTSNGRFFAEKIGEKYAETEILK